MSKGFDELVVLIRITPVPTFLSNALERSGATYNFSYRLTVLENINSKGFIMTRTIGSLSVALSINSLWLEIRKFSIHITFDTFHWTPDVWVEKSGSSVNTFGNWLGLHFVATRTI